MLRCVQLACRHGGGVLKNLSDSLVAVIIPEGAHHIDLMFSNELDPPSVQQARGLPTRQHPQVDCGGG